MDKPFYDCIKEYEHNSDENHYERIMISDYRVSAYREEIDMISE